MKKLFFLLFCMSVLPIGAYADSEYPICKCEDVSQKYDTYSGVRLYKNEHSAFVYSLPGGFRDEYTKDNFGFGTTIGNRLNDFVRVEYETMYMGAEFKMNGRDFDYNIWTNMLNVYLLYDFDRVVAPYIGAGVGLTGLWGEVDNELDNALDLSYQAMIGVLFSLNKRIDLEVGFKYANFGKIDHGGATSKVDATQIYVGAAYKFGM